MRADTRNPKSTGHSGGHSMYSQVKKQQAQFEALPWNSAMVDQMRTTATSAKCLTENMPPKQQWPLPKERPLPLETYSFTAPVMDET